MVRHAPRKDTLMTLLATAATNGVHARLHVLDNGRYALMWKSDAMPTYAFWNYPETAFKFAVQDLFGFSSLDGRYSDDARRNEKHRLREFHVMLDAAPDLHLAARKQAEADSQCRWLSGADYFAAEFAAEIYDHNLAWLREGDWRTEAVDEEWWREGVERRESAAYEWQ